MPLSVRLSLIMHRVPMLVLCLHVFVCSWLMSCHSLTISFYFIEAAADFKPIRLVGGRGPPVDDRGPPVDGRRPPVDGRGPPVDDRGPSRGRVEVYYGHWGTVCGYNFDKAEADVVCRELEFPGATRYYRYAYFGPGSGPIWLTNLGCIGNETSLDDCHDGTDIGNTSFCNHYHDAGVVCQGNSIKCLYCALINDKL